MARKRANGEGNISKRKDGLWQASITLGFKENGKQDRKYVYGKTQGEVREKLDGIRTQLQTGTFVRETKTVGEYLALWLEHKELQGAKPRTLERYEQLMRSYVLPRLGNHLLAKLTTATLRSALNSICTDISADAANKCRTLLIGALQQAVYDGLMVQNVVKPIPKFKREVKERPMWTLEQARCFLETAKSHRLYAAFHLALATGMRHGEVLGLRWQDLEGDTLFIRQALVKYKNSHLISTPKTERGKRRVTLSAETLQVLEQHREHQAKERDKAGALWVEVEAPYNDLVFRTEDGKVLNPSNFDRIWRTLRNRSGVPPIAFHDLRHMHVTLLAEGGVNPVDIAQRVGHINATFTMGRYAHSLERGRRVAAISLSSLLKEKSLEDIALESA